MPTSVPLPAPGYDDLVLHRVTRVASDADPQVITHLVYELSLRSPASGPRTDLFKVVRLGSPTAEFFPSGFDQLTTQRNMLASLRHRGSNFITVSAQLPGLAPLTAYGAQAVAPTLNQAVKLADAEWDKLTCLALGHHNRFLLPLSLAQVDTLTNAQKTWDQVAMISGASSPTNHAGRRPTTDGEFVTTLVASPLPSAVVALAWHQANRDVELGVASSECQEHLRRCSEGLEYGAYLYQMFTLTPTPSSVSPHAASLPPRALSSSDPDEALRLRIHAATFTSDVRPALDQDSIEAFLFSSYATVTELAALSPINLN